jgi:hypothetical protein
MTVRRLPASPLSALALALALLGPGAAHGAPPARKSGTVKLTLGGARSAAGTYPAICGPYFMMDVPGMAKAGDGLVFEADVPGVGRLQVNSEKRTAGRASKAGIVLNPTDGGSYVGDAAAPSQVVFGPKLDTAKVRAKLRNLRFKRGAPPDEVDVVAEFDCSR